MWNGFDAGVPFGGYKTSGIGREKGEAALSHYTQVLQTSLVSMTRHGCIPESVVCIWCCTLS